MKKLIIVSISASLLLLLGVFGAGALVESTTASETLDSSLLTSAPQAGPGRAVVILKCDIFDFTTPVTGAPPNPPLQGMKTKASSSSADAPIVPEEGCAQALADLVDEGFNITQHSNGTFFTLERK